MLQPQIINTMLLYDGKTKNLMTEVFMLLNTKASGDDYEPLKGI